jgi:hypothetical protein
MTTGRGGAPWRLIVGTIAFAAWASPSLVGLPLAALSLVARPRTAREWSVALAAGGPSLALLLLPASDALTEFARAYTVLLTAALVILILPARPVKSFPRLAVRAGLVAGVVAVVLARLELGAAAWDMLHWEATRTASATMRVMVERQPQLSSVFEPVVRFLSDTVPATLALQTLAALPLAWQWHQRVATASLGPALRPFREFRFGDHWVWAVVASLAVWITPVLAGLKVTSLNLLVTFGALYLLRGAAIVVAFSGALGISPAALTIGAAVATVLAVPLLLLVPALTTLGVTDTWLEFRRRLERRA